jgi:hypothetical protein
MQELRGRTALLTGASGGLGTSRARWSTRGLVWSAPVATNTRWQGCATSSSGVALRRRS